MSSRPAFAPGEPGSPPLWATGAKTGVGTALSTDSSVWFTLGRGIVDEVFYPFVDTACTRDLGLLVTDGKDFFSEEKRDTTSEVSWLADGVPAFRLVNTCKRGRYRIEKTIVTDPRRSVLLQQIRFVPLKGNLGDYAVFVLLNPHLGNQGEGNTAWLGEYKGVPMLFAERAGSCLALDCSVPWVQRSAGFVGTSDGWQDVSKHKKMTWAYDRAENGNVSLTGQVDLSADGGRFTLALGFGRGEGEAGHRARASLYQGFDAACDAYVRAWKDWQASLSPLKSSEKQPTALYHTSAAVMRMHESKEFPGAIIASLATPWGSSHGDGDLGYHVVWPRDMIQTVGGLLAIKAHEDARRVLGYLRVTQEADGHWPQNMHIDGLPYWDGIQLDETAFVILLVDLAQREGSLTDEDLANLWPMVRRAAGYLVRNGAVTPLDRWEEEAGYFASTLSVEIAALLAAADLAKILGEPEITAHLQETADAWNAAIDGQIYVTGTALARRAGVEGYYVRFAAPDQGEASSPASGEVTLKNHSPGKGRVRLVDLISPDALTLVRFGLRAADDPRMVNTVKVIDLVNKVDTPSGPCWHRYNEDGYGEHADGSPFDGTGIGRVWPLLTGERAHYELAAGRRAEAEKLGRVLESFANDSGLIPEQVWDVADIPERGLHFGRPSGSAMPLVWAHAEYVKLCRSLRDGRVFGVPPQTVQRYLVEKTGSPHVLWRIDRPCRSLPVGKSLRVESSRAAIVHWSTDEWATAKDSPTRDTGLGVHVVDLPTEGVGGLVFTIRWTDGDRPEGKEYRVAVTDETNP